MPSKIIAQGPPPPRLFTSRDDHCLRRSGEEAPARKLCMTLIYFLFLTGHAPVHALFNHGSECSLTIQESARHLSIEIHMIINLLVAMGYTETR